MAATEPTTTDPTPEPEPETTPDDRSPTSYVVLQRFELSAEQRETAAGIPELKKALEAVGSGRLWLEVGVSDGVGRAAAVQQARSTFGLRPRQVGDEMQVQFVPARSWKPVTLRLCQPPPEVTVDGL